MFNVHGKWFGELQTIPRQEGADRIVESCFLLLLLLPKDNLDALVLALSFCPESVLHFQFCSPGCPAQKDRT